MSNSRDMLNHTDQYISMAEPRMDAEYVKIVASGTGLRKLTLISDDRPALFVLEMKSSRSGEQVPP